MPHPPGYYGGYYDPRYYNTQQYYPQPHPPATGYDQTYLNPHTGGLHRSRSTGHRPVPNVTILNHMDNEMSPQFVPSITPGSSPRGRPLQTAADQVALEGEITALRLDLARARSRSRGSPYYGDAGAELHHANDVLRDEHMRKDVELRSELKAVRAERDAKDARKRAVEAWEAEKREQEEERKNVIAEYERHRIQEEKDAKEAEAAFRLKMKLKEDKEKKEYETFLEKQKILKAKEEADKKKKDDEMNEAMRKRFAEFGFQNNQIQALMHPDQTKLHQSHNHHGSGLSPRNPLRYHNNPTYPKVHREDVLVETLTYYDIPWEHDRHHKDYIIILREMDKRETDLLFEHSRRIRDRGTTRLLIEERGNHHGKHEYAWVRRKKHASRSPFGRRRSSPKHFVIGEL